MSIGLCLGPLFFSYGRISHHTQLLSSCLTWYVKFQLPVVKVLTTRQRGWAYKPASCTVHKVKILTASSNRKNQKPQSEGCLRASLPRVVPDPLVRKPILSSIAAVHSFPLLIF